MTNYFYSEEFQDFPKSQKKQEPVRCQIKPSKLTIQFVLGYGAALSILKSPSIGNVKILLN